MRPQIRCLVWLTVALGISASHPRGSVSKPSPFQSVEKRDGDAPLFTYDELWDLQIRYLDNFLYPANIKQAKSINSTLFAENVQGRIDITRNFDGRELNTEYIFGLFSNLVPSELSYLGYPVTYEVLQFAGNDYVTSTTTRFDFFFPSLNLTTPVMWISWHAYNAAGEITAYDATLRWWDWALDDIIEAAIPVLGALSPEAASIGLAAAMAKNVCKTAQTYCNSTNTPREDLFADPLECYAFLTTQIRFGKAYELGRNTLLCRVIHQNMVVARPSEHCKHIGPTGGGMCDDSPTYAEKVVQDYFTTSFVPFGKVGKSAGST